VNGDLFGFGCIGLGNGHRQQPIDQFGIHLVRVDVAGQADDPGELAGFALTAVIATCSPSEAIVRSPERVRFRPTV
jgi:hypothetical protein